MRNKEEISNENEEVKIKDNYSSKVVKDKYSCEYFKATIPILPLNLAIMIFLCNLFFPSLGTFYMGCIGNTPRKTQFLIAVLQLVTIPFVVGIIWSWYWGYLTIGKSYSPSKNHN